MKWKKLECVSVDGSIDSQDAAHDINCKACAIGYNYAMDSDTLLTHRKFFGKEIESCIKPIRNGLQLVITDVDAKDVTR